MTMDNKPLSADFIEIYSIKYPCITRMMIQNPEMHEALFLQLKNDMKHLADEHKGTGKTNIRTCDILVHCIRELAMDDSELKGMELLKNLMVELANISDEQYLAILSAYNKAKQKEA